MTAHEGLPEGLPDHEVLIREIVRGGVFKGSDQLTRLAEFSEFWDRQEYQTRLYFGDGIADYLQRGVLQSALKSFAKAIRERDEARSALFALEARCGELEARLAIVLGVLRRCDHNPLGEFCVCMLRNRNEEAVYHAPVCRDVRALLSSNSRKEGEG